MWGKKGLMGVKESESVEKSEHQQFHLDDKRAKKHTRERQHVKTSIFQTSQLHRRRSVCVVRGSAVCGTHSAHVTGVAEEMRVQREALRARLIRELLTTLLRGVKKKKKEKRSR